MRCRILTFVLPHAARREVASAIVDAGGKLPRGLVVATRCAQLLGAAIARAGGDVKAACEGEMGMLKAAAGDGAQPVVGGRGGRYEVLPKISRSDQDLKISRSRYEVLSKIRAPMVI